MRYRKQDENGDIIFGFGQNDFYKDNVEAVAQAIKTRLLLFLGEWFLNVDDGTPYLQGILGKHDDETRDLIIRNRILNTEDVTSIESYEAIFNAENRTTSISVIVNTIYGQSNLIEVTA